MMTQVVSMYYLQQTRLGEGMIHKKYLQFKQKYPSNFVREKQFYDCIIEKVSQSNKTQNTG